MKPFLNDPFYDQFGCFYSTCTLAVMDENISQSAKSFLSDKVSGAFLDHGASSNFTPSSSDEVQQWDGDPQIVLLTTNTVLETHHDRNDAGESAIRLIFMPLSPPQLVPLKIIQHLSSLFFSLLQRV